MNPKTLVKMIAALLLSGMVGCNDSGGGSGSATPAGNVSKLDLAKVSELQGTWASGCVVDSINLEGESAIEVVNFSGASVDSRRTVYFNPSCSGRGDYMTRAEFDVVDAGGNLPFGRSIDMVYKRGTTFIVSKNALDYFKRSFFCDTSQWILGSNDLGSKKCETYRIGDTAYGMYNIENDFLYLATPDDQDDGTSPEKRPKTYVDAPLQRVK